VRGEGGRGGRREGRGGGRGKRVEGGRKGRIGRGGRGEREGGKEGPRHAYLDVTMTDAMRVQVLQSRHEAEEELGSEGGREDAAGQGTGEAFGALVVVHGGAALEVLREDRNEERGQGGSWVRVCL